MLLDANGHLRLTDLGLCKKVGDPIPTEEPEAVLAMLRNQTLWQNTNMGSPSNMFPSEAASDFTHSATGDAMAMSVDGEVNKPDPRTRREVSCCVGFKCRVDSRRLALSYTIVVGT